MWAKNELFSNPALYELCLCYNYQVYTSFLKRYFSKGSYLFYPGCGTGYAAQLLANEGYKIFAVDINSAALSYAERNHSHPDITYRCMDAANVDDFSNTVVDGAMTINNTFRHFLSENDVSGHLHLVQKLVKPGGLYINHLSVNHSLLLNGCQREWAINLISTKNGSNNQKVPIRWTVEKVSQMFTYESITVDLEKNKKVFTSCFQQRNWNLSNLIDLKRQFGFNIIGVFNSHGKMISPETTENLDIFVVCKNGREQ